MPVFCMFFYHIAFQFREKFTILCRDSKTQNGICLHQKVPKFETKIRFTLEIPARKALWFRTNVFEQENTGMLSAFNVFVLSTGTPLTNRQ